MAYTTINKPTDYFNTKLYTGDGTDGREITGVGFQPDWCWFKARSTAYENQVYDVVRGATKRLVTNDTTAEGTQTNGLQSFDSDGFTVGNGNGTNVNAVTYASWNWLANGTGVSNTDGSITSTVSANTTSGFSIVSYTGNNTQGVTVGHGLGVAPKMIIFKSRNGTENWITYHDGIGNTKAIFLNLTNAEATASSNFWNNTSPTSSVFTLGDNSNHNDTSADMIAYCFADVKGFSKFGSYTGNGNADGTFVYTGFKPSFVLVKRTDTTGYEWSIWDNKRDPFNLADTTLRPNSAATESTIGSFYQIDMLSQGYKFRTSNGDVNDSGGTYIYMAFAEEPLVGDNPATAR